MPRYQKKKNTHAELQAQLRKSIQTFGKTYRLSNHVSTPFKITKIITKQPKKYLKIIQVKQPVPKIHPQATTFARAYQNVTPQKTPIRKTPIPKRIPFLSNPKALQRVAKQAQEKRADFKKKLAQMALQMKQKNILKPFQTHSIESKFSSGEKTITVSLV